MFNVANILKKLFGTKSEKDLKTIQPLVGAINQIYAGLATISADELRQKTKQFQTKIQQHIAEEVQKINTCRQKAEDFSVEVQEKDDLYAQIDVLEKQITEKVEKILLEILPEAFAVIRETARRLAQDKQITVQANDFDKELALKKDCLSIQGDKAIWKNTWTAAGTEVSWEMVHYDVQLIGGIVLHQGKISEMATGEGKTLVATLPVYLNALSGRGVHLVTVNDYLAKRDSEWMAPIFEFHGLTVDCIDNHQPNSPGRRAAYLADITYGTNNEFGFDYLRDNMASNVQDLVQRRHNYAIVDEVDSVLIDDARTPLIISGPTPKGDIHEFSEFKPKVEKLVKAQRDYVNLALADAKKLLAVQANGVDKKEYEQKQKEGGLALLRAHRGLPKNKALIKFLSEEGIRTMLQKTENYHMQDNNKEMPKADAELYFVIDEKSNSIDLTEKGLDLITGNTEDSNFFVVPDVGARVAEIEKSSLSTQEKFKQKDELMRDYSQKVERIHTMQQLLKAYTLFERDTEYVVMENKVKIVDEQTGRIMEGRRYSDGLHQAIEAKENVRVEASTQTYATITLQNYFRMYHKLAGMTGTASTEANEFWQIYKLDVVEIPTHRPISRNDREDLVYKTNREKYNAIIQEIETLTQQKRPVLVGTTSVEISELLSKMLKMRNIKHNVLNAKLHQKEAEIVADAGYPSAVTIATNMAGRGTDIKLKEGVKEVGGLAIIGTERHESRRVDRQLRGRSGRQGDPGSSQFFVSLEDNLMRLFGSERIAGLMDRMGHKEGDMIQHSMITKSIERAQKKVEENHFGTRKRLLEYDDVMNSQREVIYKKRRHALYEDRLSTDISDALYDVVDSICQDYHSEKDFEGFSLELIKTLSMESPFNGGEFLKKGLSDLTQELYHAVQLHYEDKKKALSDQAFPVIKNVFENQGSSYENMVVPFSDGLKQLNVVANLKKCYDSHGKYVITALEKAVTLAFIDDSWKEHLRELDDLKQNIQGGAFFEQKDPLVTYKLESYNLFKKMIDRVNREIIGFLLKASLPVASPEDIRQAPISSRTITDLKTSRTDLDQTAKQQEAARNQAQGERPRPQPVVAEQRVGRNDPCPCGSGKKYKQCHGSAE